MKIKLNVLFFTSILVLCCAGSFAQKFETIHPPSYNLVRFHSKSVKDTYALFIKKPKGYDKEPGRKYTTIYLLDANIYFDIMAAMVEKYNEMGIMAPVVLVGIGYDNFKQMEELRTRDYLYPKAIPSYKMKKSGGADKFQQFIQSELIPYIDSTYRTKTDTRVLMGHSFGGYFCLYALLENMARQDNIFRSYVAVSPALQYNNKFLFSLLNERKEGFTTPRFVYTSMGAAEDEENGDQEENINAMFTSFNKQFAEKAFKNVLYKGETYTGFRHLETAVAGFSKGLFYIWVENR